MCGGNSTRMGEDKGLIKNGVITWAELAFQKLDQLEIPVCVSINAQQEDAYKEIFSLEYLVVDNGNPLKGPAKGIMSVHELFPDKDLLVLACDLPYLQESTIQHLYFEYRDHQYEQDFFVYQNDGYPEPLCGIYKFTGLEAILQLAKEGRIEKNSMQYLLSIANTRLIPLPTDLVDQFKNLNSQEDI